MKSAQNTEAFFCGIVEFPETLPEKIVLAIRLCYKNTRLQDCGCAEHKTVHHHTIHICQRMTEMQAQTGAPEICDQGGERQPECREAYHRKQEKS